MVAYSHRWRAVSLMVATLAQEEPDATAPCRVPRPRPAARAEPAGREGPGPSPGGGGGSFFAAGGVSPVPPLGRCQVVTGRGGRGKPRVAAARALARAAGGGWVLLTEPEG